MEDALAGELSSRRVEFGARGGGRRSRKEFRILRRVFRCWGCRIYLLC